MSYTELLIYGVIAKNQAFWSYHSKIKKNIAQVIIIYRCSKNFTLRIIMQEPNT